MVRDPLMFSTLSFRSEKPTSLTFNGWGEIAWHRARTVSSGSVLSVLSIFPGFSTIFHHEQSCSTISWIKTTTKKQPNHTSSKCLRPKVVSLAQNPGEISQFHKRHCYLNKIRMAGTRTTTWIIWTLRIATDCAWTKLIAWQSHDGLSMFIRFQ